ncbi:MAG: hypothetical protein LLF90_04520 [Methanomicrobiaceae archaeon]|uniref:hypothetical protein n=1 Tax=Methanoculleus sp. TaxID=90427 RepID=UPI00320FE419|nr:hypothetical protein [Methanomicrobiaceae archaeon]
MNQNHIGVIALLVCTIIVVAIALGSGALDGTGSPGADDSTPPLVIGDAMTVLVAGAASAADLAAAGIPAPEVLQIPKGIKRYDVVTFDHAALSREIRDGLPLSIHGTAYRAEQHGMSFEQVDDGINTYEGMIVGVDGSDILLTTGKNVLVGSITFGNETFWIVPIEPRARAEQSESPLHVIYSSKDVLCPAGPPVPID